MAKIYAPIDNKNLLEDPFEDEVFKDFYAAPDHRVMGGKRRHLIGRKTVTDKYGMYYGDGIVDVKWCYGDHSIDIQVLAVPGTEDYETVRDAIFDDYEREFKSWMCEDNPGLLVETKRVLGILTVSFYFVD